MFFWGLRVDYDIVQINETICMLGSVHLDNSA